MFNIAELKKEIVKNISTLIETRDTFATSARTLVLLGDRDADSHYLPSLANAFSSLLKVHFTNEDNRLTNLYSNNLPVEIACHFGYYTFENRHDANPERYLSSKIHNHLSRQEKASQHEQAIALEELVHEMPWEEIKRHYDDQCSNAKNVGMRNAIDKVHKYFRISIGRDKPSLKKERYVISRHYCGHAYDLHTDVQEVEAVISALSPMTDEASVSMGDSLQAFRRALIENCQTSTPIPMRTRFGKGSELDITVFKSKVTFSLGPCLMEAIQSATIMYGTDENINDVMNLVKG